MSTVEEKGLYVCLFIYKHFFDNGCSYATLIYVCMYVEYS
jgi:hypothetical protein